MRVPVSVVPCTVTGTAACPDSLTVRTICRRTGSTSRLAVR
jgi:hypothetical protein